MTKPPASTPLTDDGINWEGRGEPTPEWRAAVAAVPAPKQKSRRTPRPRTTTVHVTDTLTECGAAERFARRYADDVRFDHQRDRWLLWQDHRWMPDRDQAIVRLALTFARDWQRELIEIADRDRREAALKFAIRLERRDALNNMLTLARALKPIADVGDGWDLDGWLLGVPNGVVDLRTGQLRAGRREDRITMSTTAPYEPDAYSERWQAALQSILVADETVTFVHKAMGYSITGDVGRDCWFLSEGTGRNGKGTVIHPARRALGDYATEVPASVFDARRDAPPYDLAVLPGKRFVVSSESGDTIRLHHDRIKQITGGDPIRAANKYEKSFEFQPVCKLWLAANKKPRVTDDSPAFWARVMLVPFRVSFRGHEDRTLRPALEQEPEHQTAILAWLVHGATRYAAEGLEPTATVRSATADYEQECDALADFASEACEPVDPPETSEVRAHELFEHYTRWASARGLTERERLTMTAFGLKAKTRWMSEKRNYGRVYLGVARRNWTQELEDA